jgi:hypothetical protein
MTTKTNGAWTPPASIAAREAGYTPCECGCGALCPRRFRPGHDATLKSALIRTVLIGERDKASAAERQAGEQAEARLARLDWSGHLALSRKARDAKRKPKPEAKAAPKPKAAKSAAAIPTTERRAGTDGRVPASVGRLSGRVGRLGRS